MPLIKGTFEIDFFARMGDMGMRDADVWGIEIRKMFVEIYTRMQNNYDEEENQNELCIYALVPCWLGLWYDLV